MQARASEDRFWSEPLPWPWPVAGWALLALLAVALHWHSFESEDVTWLVLAADRLIDGGRWGVDILENNTPAAVLIYVPAVLAARVLPLDPMQACDLWVIAILIGCSLAVGRVFAAICHVPPRTPQSVVAGFVTFGVFAFGTGNFGLPMFGLGNNFGQRDHLIAALLMPIAFLILWRDFQPAENRRLHRVALAMAAVAFCIKPQFLVPFAIWILVALYRHGWRVAVVRIGLAWLVPAGALYIGAVLLIFPEWLATAELAAKTYGAYLTAWGDLAIASIPAFLLLVVAWRGMPSAGAATPLLRAATICGASYLLLIALEQKAWFYHQLPPVLTLLTGLGLAIVAQLPAIAARRHGGLEAVVIAALIPGFLLLTTWRSQAALLDAYARQPLIQALHREMKPGDPWAVISVSSLPAFPTSTMQHYRWVLRGPSLWPLPGALERARDNRSDGAEAVTTLAEQLADDIARGKPKVIVLDRVRSDLLPDDDLLDLLRQAPRFATVWAGYRFEEAAGDFDLYVPRDQP